LPQRDRNLLVWLLAGDVVTADLAALLVYGHLRTAQRRLARLVELSLLRGFWAASSNRPRGRHAYELTRAARLDIELIVWPEGRPSRSPDPPASAPIHQLSTLDLLAAFLRHGDPQASEGLVAWVPERACGRLFDGFVRPDGLAVIRVRDRIIPLFVERDLGTERGDALPEKIRRYRSAAAGRPDLVLTVGFVVESERRARTIHDLLTGRASGTDGAPQFVTAVVEPLLLDPSAALWSDGQDWCSIRQLAALPTPTDLPILHRGCLADGDALAALDERAVAVLTSDPRRGHRLGDTAPSAT
jgi:hypothetical protein